MRKDTYVDITGKRFHFLVALSKVKGVRLLWLFRCDCGREKMILSHHVKQGRTISCGCRRNKSKATHGMSRTRFYKIWKNIRTRSGNDKGNRAKYYSNVLVDPRWDRFEEFKNDMYDGYRAHADVFGEKNTTIDRKESTQGYSYSNCRWATYKVQASNRRPRSTVN